MNCEMDAVFKALADESRRKLLDQLHQDNGQALGELCAHLDMTRQAVTKHLDVLAQVGLVRDVKLGRERLWEFEPGPLDQARNTLSVIAEQWDHALARLKRLPPGMPVDDAREVAKTSGGPLERSPRRPASGGSSKR